jgi:uncharacterized protein YecE (DUF72 family)
VGPADVSPELRELAKQLPPGVRLGTSSWSFPGWEGLVFDREASNGHLARYGLAAYAQHPLLRAVGIDRTFYAPLTALEFAAYAEEVPDDFRFLVKAWSDCTSPYLRGEGGRPAGRNPNFLDPEFAAREVVTPFVEGLGAKAGPLVFQFPPLGRKYTQDAVLFIEMLGGFLCRLPAGPTYAVEVRDKALMRRELFTTLEIAGARPCLNVHARMPPVARQQALSGAPHGPMVARWMLHSGFQYEEAVARYEPFDRIVDEDPASRDALAGTALEHAAAGFEALIIVNNKAEGSAPLTVERLARRIVETSSPGGRNR